MIFLLITLNMQNFWNIKNKKALSPILEDLKAPFEKDWKYMASQKNNTLTKIAPEFFYGDKTNTMYNIMVISERVAKIYKEILKTYPGNFTVRQHIVLDSKKNFKAKGHIKPKSFSEYYLTPLYFEEDIKIDNQREFDKFVKTIYNNKNFYKATFITVNIDNKHCFKIKDNPLMNLAYFRKKIGEKSMKDYKVDCSKIETNYKIIE